MAYDIRRVFQKMAQGARSDRAAKALSGPGVSRAGILDVAKQLSKRRGQRRFDLPSPEATRRYLRSRGETVQPHGSAAPAPISAVPAPPELLKYPSSELSSSLPPAEMPSTPQPRIRRQHLTHTDTERIMNPDLLNIQDPLVQAPERELSRQVNLYRKKSFGGLGMTPESIAALQAKIRRQQWPMLNAWDRLATSGRHNLNIIEVPAITDPITERVYDPRTTFYGVERPGAHATGPYGQHALSTYGTDRDASQERRRLESPVSWFGGQGHPAFPPRSEHRGPDQQARAEPLVLTKRPTLAMQQAAHPQGRTVSSGPEPPAIQLQQFPDIENLLNDKSISDVEFFDRAQKAIEGEDMFSGGEWAEPGRPGGGTGRQWIASIPHRPSSSLSTEGLASPEIPTEVIEGFKIAVMAPGDPDQDPQKRWGKQWTQFRDMVERFGGKLDKDYRVTWGDPKSIFPAGWEGGVDAAGEELEPFTQLSEKRQGGVFEPNARAIADARHGIEQAIAGHKVGMQWVLRNESSSTFKLDQKSEEFLESIEKVQGREAADRLREKLMSDASDQPRRSAFAEQRKLMMGLARMGWMSDTRQIREEPLRLLAQEPIVETSESARSPQLGLPGATITMTHPRTGDKLWVTSDAKIYKLMPTGRGYQQVFGKQVADATTGAGSVLEHGIPGGSGIGGSLSLQEALESGRRRARGRKPPGGRGSAAKPDVRRRAKGKGKGKGKGRGPAGAAGAGIIGVPILKQIWDTIKEERRRRSLP